MDNLSDSSNGSHAISSIVDSTGRLVAKGINNTIQTTIDTYDTVKENVRRNSFSRPKSSTNKILVEG